MMKRLTFLWCNHSITILDYIVSCFIIRNLQWFPLQTRQWFLLQHYFFLIKGHCILSSCNPATTPPSPSIRIQYNTYTAQYTTIPKRVVRSRTPKNSTFWLKIPTFVQHFEISPSTPHAAELIGAIIISRRRGKHHKFLLCIGHHIASHRHFFRFAHLNRAIHLLHCYPKKSHWNRPPTPPTLR